MSSLNKARLEMKIELEKNEVNYIRELLRKDARERGDTDVANWCLFLSDKFDKAGN